MGRVNARSGDSVARHLRPTRVEKGWPADDPLGVQQIVWSQDAENGTLTPVRSVLLGTAPLANVRSDGKGGYLDGPPPERADTPLAIEAAAAGQGNDDVGEQDARGGEPAAGVGQPDRARAVRRPAPLAAAAALLASSLVNLPASSMAAWSRGMRCSTACSSFGAATTGMAGDEIGPPRGTARDGGSDGAADQPTHESAEAGTGVFLGKARADARHDGEHRKNGQHPAHESPLFCRS